VETPGRLLNAFFDHLQLERSDVGYGNIGSSLKSISGLVPKVHEEIENRFTRDFLRIGQKDDPEHFGSPFTRWRRFFLERGRLKESEELYDSKEFL
jgi:hypothetical protein